VNWSLELVVVSVSDIEAAHGELTGRGAEISEIYQFESGSRKPGRIRRVGLTTRSSRSAIRTATAGSFRRSAVDGAGAPVADEHAFARREHGQRMLKAGYEGDRSAGVRLRERDPLQHAGLPLGHER